MTRGRPWPPATRAEALNAYADHGPRAAARITGVPASTIASWAAADGLVTEAPTRGATDAATEAHQVAAEARNLALAHQFLDDVERLRAQLFAPAVERNVWVLGAGEGRTVQVLVEVHRPMPSVRGQLDILTGVGIAVDRVVDLTGPVHPAAHDSRLDMVEVNSTYRW